MVSLHRLIDQRFGVRTRGVPNPDNVQQSTTVGRVMRNDSSRLAATIVNLGTNPVFITPDNAPATNRGIRLGPSGGFTTLLWDEDFNLVGLEWFGITDAGTSNLFVLEVRVEPGSVINEDR